MKKIIAPFIMSSILFTSTAFASQSLSEIMATQREEMSISGALQATQHATDALLENNISQSELRAYLESELSPRDFKKIDSSLSKGMNLSEVPDLILNLSSGANFKGAACNSGLVFITAAIAGVTAVITATLASADLSRTIDGYDQSQISVNQQNISDLQSQIADLQTAGVPLSSQAILTKQSKIAADQANIIQIRSDADKWVNDSHEKGKSLRRDAVIETAIAGVAGIVSYSCN